MTRHWLNAGRGGVGIVRVSGPAAQTVAQAMVKTALTPRMAMYTPFYDAADTVIDQGIALFFKGPNSFTGEDVLELQGHGGQVVMDMGGRGFKRLPEWFGAHFCLLMHAGKRTTNKEKLI